MMNKRKFMVCLAAIACNPLKLIPRKRYAPVWGITADGSRAVEVEKPVRPLRYIYVQKHIREHPNYKNRPDIGEDIIARGTTHYPAFSEARDAKGRLCKRRADGFGWILA
jgi:hypothetical protein